MNAIKSILLLSALVFLGCNDNKKDPLQASPEDESGLVHVSKAQFENAKMEIGSLTEKPFAQTVHTSGMIDVPPQSKAVISAFSGGYIKNTPLLIGDKVRSEEHTSELQSRPH